MNIAAKTKQWKVYITVITPGGNESHRRFGEGGDGRGLRTAVDSIQDCVLVALGQHDVPHCLFPADEKGQSPTSPGAPSNPISLVGDLEAEGIRPAAADPSRRGRRAAAHRRLGIIAEVVGLVPPGRKAPNCVVTSPENRLVAVLMGCSRVEVYDILVSGDSAATTGARIAFMFRLQCHLVYETIRTVYGIFLSNCKGLYAIKQTDY
ncbi:uncharacterized protein PgNI_07252 [Pyricularia grisea]|uniref:Uncharacterized protein n=1 Tax=Pyricularia grisea TaxID=148305 RepID=A0A6P8B0K4_PYRGI|nr:uncharacterized protein PgNI_07252 [Pyricularia grisea]TLD08382.1 hypothetical protein PgNI_07252 [Pyricularia grisea]